MAMALDRLIDDNPSRRIEGIQEFVDNPDFQDAVLLFTYEAYETKQKYVLLKTEWTNYNNKKVSIWLYILFYNNHTFQTWMGEGVGLQLVECH